MTSSVRVRETLQAWQDHLITTREAMEIVGVEEQLDLLAAGSSQRSGGVSVSKPSTGAKSGQGAMR